MNIDKEFSSVKSNVKEILETYPASRESDKRLVLHYYWTKHEFLGGNYHDIVDWFMREEIPTFSTILRCRTWLQSHYPHLRGKNYKKRQSKADGVRDYILDANGESYSPYTNE